MADGVLLAPLSQPPLEELQGVGLFDPSGLLADPVVVARPMLPDDPGRLAELPGAPQQRQPVSFVLAPHVLGRRPEPTGAVLAVPERTGYVPAVRGRLVDPDVLDGAFGDHRRGRLEPDAVVAREWLLVGDPVAQELPRDASGERLASAVEPIVPTGTTLALLKEWGGGIVDAGLLGHGSLPVSH